MINKINRKLINFLKVANAIMAPCIMVAGAIWMLNLGSDSDVWLLLLIIGLCIGAIGAIFTCGPIAVLISIKESLDDIKKSN